jgi:molybdate transport system substrate-binding protein
MHLLFVFLLLADTVAAQETIRVAVAANFRATLEQINASFEQRTGYRVVLSSASTGTLYSQIRHGAPFDLFFAADSSAPAKLATDASFPFCYAIGRLSLVGGKGELGALGNPSLSLAIANPVTAPYGAAALEVLQRPEFASGAKRKMLRGNSVVHAYQFWHSGGADLALIALAIAPEGTPVPGDWHQQLAQHALVLPRGQNRSAVDAYLKWIRSDTVQTVISNAGYETCP